MLNRNRVQALLCMGIVGFAASAGRGDFIAFNGSQGSGAAQGPFQIADNFNVTGANGITITQLGFFDDGAPGSLNFTTNTATTGASGSTPANGLSESHVVNLYNRTTTTILATATIPAGTANSTLTNGFRFVPITPVFLPSGTQASIVGYTLSNNTSGGNRIDDYGENSTFSGNSLITFVNSTFLQTSATTGLPTGNAGANTFGTGNFQYVAAPEPASLGLLGVGAVGLLARRRRRA